MRTSIFHGFLLCLIACAAARHASAQAPPTTRPAATDTLISDMRVQTIAPITYLHDSDRTSFQDIAKRIDRTLPNLTRAVDEGKIHPKGPVIFVYRDMTDLSKPFTLDIGMPVAENGAAPEGFSVTRLTEFKCATILYSGPVGGIGKAYEKLMSQITAANLEPVAGSREFYLYWEGPESVNNVVQIQIGIK